MKINISKRSKLLVPGFLLLFVVVYFAVPQIHDAISLVVKIWTENDTQQAINGFRDYLLTFGVWAPAVSALLMVFQAVVAPLPAFIITFTNGLLFGWVWGAALSWSSAMLGAIVCFWIARTLGRPVVEKLAGGTKSLEVSDLFFDRYGNKAILISRLLPFVSFDIISYGAGLTPVKFWKFFVATGIGQLPATLVYSYLGQNLSGSAKVLFWVFSITAVIFVIGWAVGPRFLQRLRAQSGQAESKTAAQASEAGKV